MATAASCYATSISGHIGLGSRALPSQDRPGPQRCFTVRCNAAPEKGCVARGGAAAASRRSMLAAGIALPFSVLYAERARAFVEGEEISGGNSCIVGTFMGHMTQVSDSPIF